MLADSWRQWRWRVFADLRRKEYLSRRGRWRPMNALADRQDNFRSVLDPYGAVTHEVFNQPVELADINLYGSDAALKEAVQREGAGWASDALEAFGARAGSDRKSVV